MGAPGGRVTGRGPLQLTGAFCARRLGFFRAAALALRLSGSGDSDIARGQDKPPEPAVSAQTGAALQLGGGAPA